MYVPDDTVFSSLIVLYCIKYFYYLLFIWIYVTAQILSLFLFSSILLSFQSAYVFVQYQGIVDSLTLTRNCQINKIYLHGDAVWSVDFGENH